MNNTNLAKGGDTIHQIIEPYQTEQDNNTWEQTTQKQKQKRFSNYSGHHMKASYQQSNKHMGKATNNKNNKKHNDFQIVWPWAP